MINFAGNRSEIDGVRAVEIGLRFIMSRFDVAELFKNFVINFTMLVMKGCYIDFTLSFTLSYHHS